MIAAMRWALALLLCLGFVGSSEAFSIPWETQSGSRSSPPYGWSYAYDIGVVDDVLWVDVDIALTGFEPGPLWDIWESGIERIWATDRFDVPIRLNVDRVTDGTQDQLVTLTDGNGRWNMLHWYTMGPGGGPSAYYQGVAAHEVGHMLGLYDEYAGGAVDPVTRLINTGGLMQWAERGTLDAYYAPFLSWYDAHRPVSVPEPMTLELLGVALVGLTLARAWARGRGARPSTDEGRR